MRAFIARARWIFARTMPASPHWYTLRRANPVQPFEAFVAFIRRHGYDAEYAGGLYRKLDTDGWSYWTMGAPLGETILINRARLVGATPQGRLRFRDNAPDGLTRPIDVKHAGPPAVLRSAPPSAHL
jgi:hypothetical protein